jgi:hypothetical protein
VTPPVYLTLDASGSRPGASLEAALYARRVFETQALDHPYAEMSAAGLIINLEASHA